MEDTIRNTTSDNLVNYSDVATSATNQIVVSPTESPESLSFLIKNNVMIAFTLTPESEEKPKEPQPSPVQGK